MENNCMANPCEGCTEEACVEMMKKLQADEKVKQLLDQERIATVKKYLVKCWMICFSCQK